MIRIDRIDPPGWFAGMADNSLQLVVYGCGLKGSRFSTDMPGVRADVVYESDTHLVLHLSGVADCPVGDYSMMVCKGDRSDDCRYRLSKRLPPFTRLLSAADTVYLAVADRFCHGAATEADDIDRANDYGWHGGDIPGLRSKIGYLDKLGVTALWVTPVMKNNRIAEGGSFTSYHGYAITDFYGIDPHFGSIDDYRSLVADAHGHGMKVVMDMVFNHCGDEHPWVDDPPMPGWINDPSVLTNYNTSTVLDPYASARDRRATVEGWFTPHMADLNLSNPEVLTYMTQMSIWWIETAGIDAIRMDTFLYSPIDALKQWLTRLRREYGSFPVIAETWMAHPALTARTQQLFMEATGSEMPLVVMDFAFQQCVADILSHNGHADALSLYTHFAVDYLYPAPQSTLAFFDNHDINRLTAVASPAAMRQAIGLLLTSPRIPQIYYGTEIMLRGRDYGDGAMRRDMPGGWPDDVVDKFDRRGRNRDEQSIHDFTSRLLRYRAKAEELTRGRMVHFLPVGDVYVYFRVHRERLTMVAINFSGVRKVVDLERFDEVLHGELRFKDVVTGRRVDLSSGNLTIAQRGIRILTLR